jgi:two-component system, LuxR family, sensor kinase FixL
MSWVTVIWSMVAATCLTLAVLHLLVWCRNRMAWANLLFALTAIGTAGIAACELWMMRAGTAAEFGTALRWIHVPGWLMIVSLVAFVRLHLRAGRLWLAWAVCGLRTLSLILDFVFTPNLNYREITSLRHIRYLGDTISVGEGVSNPWMLIGQASLALLVVFTVDAMITAWRRGDRRPVLVLGGAIVFFTMAGTVQIVLGLWEIVHTPLTPSLFFLGIVAAMGYELSRDVLRAAQLSAELRQSEEFKKAILDSVAANITVLDSQGVIVAVNERWQQLALENPTSTGGPPRNIGPGANYLEACRQSSGESAENAMAAHDGIQAVLAGRMKSFTLEYPCHSPQQQRWFSMTVTPLGREGPSVVVAHVDITGRKHAEQEIAQQRNEVAHLSRVTTLGEISGSLAHELNQPLCAMLVNTDSAQLHLQSSTPNLPEVRAILADIHKDGLRAGEIIHGMRTFLRRKELDMQPLEFGHLAGEAVKLISADAATRKTTVGLEIPPGLPRVTGDRVHLQQVLLNLLVNGMDAMSNCLVADRHIIIRATQPDLHTVQIAVSDQGVGIAPGELDRIFTPFHTTKHGGLGLGLPICRSIIEAHGGSISITNNPDRGTTARFSLLACVEGQAQ